MTVPVPAERPPSLWEDLLEIFYAPRAVFERRRETPAFGLALVVFAVLMIGLAVAFQSITEPVIDAELKRSMAVAMKQNPQLTPEMAAGFSATGKKFALVGVAVYALIIPLLLGLALWVVGKLLDSKAEVGQMMMVATYALFPRIIETIVNAIQLLLLPEDGITSHFSLTLGIGRFLDPDTQSVLIAVLGRVDVFTLWITTLMGIGLAVMGRIPRGRAILGALIMWLIGGILPIWGAVRAAG